MYAEHSFRTFREASSYGMWVWNFKRPCTLTT